MSFKEVSGIVSNIVAPLVDGATISFDASVAFAFSLTIAGNRTLSSPSGLVAGSIYILFLTQGGSGSNTLTYGSLFRFPTAGTLPTLSTDVGAMDALIFCADNTYLNYITIAKNELVPLSPPTALTASTNQAGQVTLNWVNHAAGQTGVYVYSDNPGPDFGIIATAGASATSYVNDGLSPGDYHYKVQAVKDAQLSVFSNTATGTAT